MTAKPERGDEHVELAAAPGRGVAPRPHPDDVQPPVDPSLVPLVENLICAPWAARCLTSRQRPCAR